MRISLLTNLFPPSVLGGAELSAFALGKELVRRGHAVSVLTLSDAEGTSVEEGMRVHRIKPRPFYSPLVSKQKPKWMKPPWHAVDLYNPFMRSRILRVLEEERPDVLHCHNIVGFSCSAWDAARAAGVPVVQHLHDYHLVCLKATLMDESLKACPTPHFPCNLRARHHARMLERHVGRIISPSAFCGRTVLGRLPGASGRQVDVIPNGTEYAESEPIRGDWEAPRLQALFLGALFEHKGFGVLAEAVERISARGLPVDFHIGGKGPMEPLARELARRFGNVRYHGFVGGELKLRLFRDAHLFVFPSIWLENNPVTITEALALGLPVLGTRVGGVPELIEPVSPELLIEPGDSSLLARRLEELALDRGTLRSASAAILATRSGRGIGRQVERTVEVYAEAAAGSAISARPPR